MLVSLVEVNSIWGFGGRFDFEIQRRVRESAFQKEEMDVTIDSYRLQLDSQQQIYSSQGNYLKLDQID